VQILQGAAETFKLLAMAQRHWRQLNGAGPQATVRSGIKFVVGIQKRVRKATQPGDDTPMGSRLIMRGDPQHLTITLVER
jgi:hypothetical protein